MKRKLFIVLTVLLFSQSIFAYKQEDVDKFKKTGICVNCDLSATTINQKTEGPINIRRSNISHSMLFLNNNAESSDLSNVIAIRSKIRVAAAHLNFRNARLSESDLSGDSLMYADFTGAHLDDVDML